MSRDFLTKIPRPLLYIATGAGVIFGSWLLVPNWFGHENEVRVSGDQSDKQEDLSTDVVQEERGKTEQSDKPKPVVQDEKQTDKPPDNPQVDDLEPLPQPTAQADEYNKAVKLLQEKKFRAASKQLGRLVERFPDDATLRYQYSKALFWSHRKRRKAAVLQMKKAIALQQDYTDAYYELGKMYFKLKKRRQARRALLAFLKLSPQGERADEAKTMLRSFKRRK